MAVTRSKSKEGAKRGAQGEAAAVKATPAGMRVLQAVLYALGPFFAYPHKPFLNYAFGCDYNHAFTNFRYVSWEIRTGAQHLEIMGLQSDGITRKHRIFLFTFAA